MAEDSDASPVMIRMQSALTQIIVVVQIATEVLSSACRAV